MTLKSHDGFVRSRETFMGIVEDFDRQYGIEFNPTAGVVSSILSQEIMKVVTKRDHPASGLLFYDSVYQTFSIE